MWKPGVKYVRRNFLCGLHRREPGSLEELNAELRQGVWEVANRRLHGTTHAQIAAGLEDAPKNDSSYGDLGRP